MFESQMGAWTCELLEITHIMLRTHFFAFKSVSTELYIVVRYFVNTRKTHTLVNYKTSIRVQICQWKLSCRRSHCAGAIKHRILYGNTGHRDTWIYIPGISQWKASNYHMIWLSGQPYSPTWLTLHADSTATWHSSFLLWTIGDQRLKKNAFGHQPHLGSYMRSNSVWSLTSHYNLFDCHSVQ